MVYGTRHKLGRVTLFITGILLAGLILGACGGTADGDLRIGDPAPPFTLPSALGEQVALADYRGSSPVLLYFHMADG